MPITPAKETASQDSHSALLGALIPHLDWTFDTPISATGAAHGRFEQLGVITLHMDDEGEFCGVQVRSGIGDVSGLKHSHRPTSSLTSSLVYGEGVVIS